MNMNSEASSVSSKSGLPSNIDSAKIFVGGLSWQSNESSLRTHFSQYGNVVSVEVMRDRNTGDPRGFAFVVFDDDATVDKVMQHRHEVDGKVVDVKRAQARGFAPPSIHPRQRQQGGAVQQQQTQSQPESVASTSVDDSTNNKIFVGGLPLHVDKEELARHFSEYGTVTDAIVMMDPTHTRSRGFGFVTFEPGTGAAQRAMADQPHSMHGKFVEIKLAQPKEGSAKNRPGQDNANNPHRTNTALPNLINSEFYGLAAAYGKFGWKAGFGSFAFGQAGWAVPGWDHAAPPPERTGFSFSMLDTHPPQQQNNDTHQEFKRPRQ